MPKPNLRAAFLEAGYETIHRDGYTASGVAAIAARAGGPKGSFYNHFASKEDLAVAVLERYGDGRRMDMLSAEEHTPLDRIAGHFAHLLADLAIDDYQRGCMFGNFAAETAGTNDRLARVVDQAFGEWHEALAGAIEAARADGSVDDSVDARDAAWFIIDAWEGAALRAKSLRSAAPLERVLALTFSTVLIAGLAPGSTSA
ncbi:TetR family transcriptional regulator C-terminal domain-containing protein [Plantibacter sp. Mn2098]|uniref:TetR/AcrR family transcriptional regulator n=1 Tax=Plantibacter sp. Mn2098 TaxID=3395266 RepID=UPI003BDDC867